MNIILLDKAEIQEDNTVFLEGERAEHLVKVLRVTNGDMVRVGEVCGLLGLGTVFSVKRKFPFAVELHIDLTTLPPPQPRLDIILALPRPIMLKRIFSQATALGIGRFFLINSKRVEKSFWKSNLLRPEEYTVHLRKGLEQAAVDTRLPEVFLYSRFKSFMEDFSRRRAEYQHAVVAHPDGVHLLSTGISEVSGRIVFAIGPEGGWLDDEVEEFIKQQFYTCSMGERILKVDTAVTAMHAQLSLLCRCASSPIC